MARFEKRAREGEAREFAETYARFESDAKLGFTTLVRESIEQAHLSVSDRQFSHEDLKSLIDTIASDKSIVSWDESGSSREKEGTVRVRPAATSQEIRQQLHELVKARMEEDSMDYAAALDVVSKENPELAQAYLAS
jgi:hypothetical protein